MSLKFPNPHASHEQYAPQDPPAGQGHANQNRQTIAGRLKLAGQELRLALKQHRAGRPMQMQNHLDTVQVNINKAIAQLAEGGPGHHPEGARQLLSFLHQATHEIDSPNWSRFCSYATAQIHSQVQNLPAQMALGEQHGQQLWQPLPQAGAPPLGQAMPLAPTVGAKQGVETARTQVVDRQPPKAYRPLPKTPEQERPEPKPYRPLPLTPVQQVQATQAGQAEESPRGRERGRLRNPHQQPKQQYQAQMMQPVFAPHQDAGFNLRQLGQDQRQKATKQPEALAQQFGFLQVPQAPLDATPSPLGAGQAQATPQGWIRGDAARSNVSAQQNAVSAQQLAFVEQSGNIALQRRQALRRKEVVLSTRDLLLAANPAGDKIKIEDNEMLRQFGSVAIHVRGQRIREHFRFSSLTGQAHEGHIVAGSMIGSGTFGKVRPGVLISADGKTKTNVIIKESRLEGPRNLSEKVGVNRFDKPRNIVVSKKDFAFEKDVAELLGGEVKVLGTRQAGNKQYLILTAMDMSSKEAATTLSADQRPLFARHTGLEVAKHLQQHVHAKGYVHGDGKPDNTLVDVLKNRVYASDFGGSKKMQNYITDEGESAFGASRLVSTYWAPEVARGELATAKYDSWTLGVTIAQIMGGDLRFPSEFHGVPARSGGVDLPATWANVAGVEVFRHRVMTADGNGIDEAKLLNSRQDRLGRFFGDLAVRDMRLTKYVLLHLLEPDPNLRHGTQEVIAHLSAMAVSSERRELSNIFRHIHEQTAELRQAHKQLHGGIAYLEGKDPDVFVKG